MVGSIIVLIPLSEIGSSSRNTSDRTPIETPLPASEADQTPTANNDAQAPALSIDAQKSYVVTIKTDKGDIKIEFDAKTSPNAVNNFVALAKRGFYNGKTTFYRVVPGAYVQGGDTNGDGSGGPGYAFPGDAAGLKANNVAGTVAMVNIGPNSFGSQFAIMLSPQSSFDGKYDVIGHVTEGLDVVGKLTPRDPTQKPDFKGDVIQNVSIEEK